MEKKKMPPVPPLVQPNNVKESPMMGELPHQVPPMPMPMESKQEMHVPMESPYMPPMQQPKASVPFQYIEKVHLHILKVRHYEKKCTQHHPRSHKYYYYIKKKEYHMEKCRYYMKKCNEPTQTWSQPCSYSHFHK